MIVTTGAYGEDPDITVQPLPEEAKKPIDILLAFTSTPCTNFSSDAVKPLVDFIRAASSTDSGWELPKRDGAAGSAYIVTVKVPLQKYLALNFHPDIPDYAVFLASLRYSTCLDSNAMRHAYSCIETGPTGSLQYVTALMSGTEEITPNPESGCYFSYTNSRVFLRCKVEGQDVLFSCAETLSPSTFSQRGVTIGLLEQSLFYYSGRPGLNVTGMSWMLSQIKHSTTLSVYISLSSNETAVATFAWLNAGWKGMNVTRACHILNSQKNTLDCSRRIAQNPKVSAPLLASIAAAVDALTPAEVDSDYEKYLAYVRIWRDKKDSAFSQGSLLKDLYDPKASQAIPLSHRRALLVQERIRVLMDIPTWSAPGAAETVARR